MVSGSTAGLRRLLDDHEMREHSKAECTPRTEANVLCADGAPIFDDVMSGGSRNTHGFCTRHHKPRYLLPWRSGQPMPLDSIGDFLHWLADNKIAVLNVASPAIVNSVSGCGRALE